MYDIIFFIFGYLLLSYDLNTLSRIYYFIKLINDFLLLRLYCIFFRTKPPTILLNILYKDVVNNGCFTIKFIQWMVTRYKMMYSPNNKPEWINLFNNFYENCPFHNNLHTQTILETEFKDRVSNIFDYFEETPISSGSIAQVHKCIYQGKECVVKVVHPDIKESTYIPLFILNLIQRLSMSRILKKLDLNIISVDLNYFINSLTQQLDLNIEANNMKKMKQQYQEDYPYVVIPECYYHTDKFIIMSYEEGQYLDDIDETIYVKYKTVLCLSLLLRSMTLIHGDIHADLHCANWKVRKIKDTQDYQIILYDFGLVITPELELVRKFIIAWEKCEHEKIADSLSFFIVNIKDKDKLKILSDDLKKEILKWTLRPINMNIILRLICQWGRENNVIFNSNFLNLIIIISLVENDFNKVGLSGNKKLEDPNEVTECVLKVEYLNYINFCQTKNIFKPLVVFMENVLKDENIEFNNLFHKLEYKLSQNGLNLDNLENNNKKEVMESLDI